MQHRINRTKRGHVYFMRCRQVQERKRYGGLYGLLGRELLRDAGGKQFGKVSQLPGQLEFCCGEFGGHSVYLQHRRERTERGPVCAVRAGEVQGGDRHVGVSELLGEHVFERDWGDVDLRVLDVPRQFTICRCECCLCV